MRLLVVQTAFLGDLVLTLPLLTELRKAYPDAEIAVVTTPVGRNLFAMTRSVDRTFAFDKRRGGLAEMWRLLDRLRRERFHVALAAHRSHRTAALLRLASIPRRIGFRQAQGRWAYTECVERRSGDHAARRYLELAVPLGVERERAASRPLLIPDPLSRQRVDRLLAVEGLGDGRALLAIAPGSAWATKRWLPERFAALAEAAIASGLAPFLVGSSAELELCERIARAARCRIPNLAGRTTIGELAALLERAARLVANDSGTGHVAAAVGTPVISVFGPTVPQMGYAPLGTTNRVAQVEALRCRPCSRHGSRSCPEGHFRCMREITVERVLGLLGPPGEPPDQRAPARRPG